MSLQRSDRVDFALYVADRVGLHPEVALGWTYFENNDESIDRRPGNWLNLKHDVDVDSVPWISQDNASDGGWFPGYGSLEDGLTATMLRLARPRYKGIRDSAGKSKDEQLQAIRDSGWGTTILGTANYTDLSLYRAWAEWHQGWGVVFSKHGAASRAHRPEVFPTKISKEWWARLTRQLDARKR